MPLRQSSRQMSQCWKTIETVLQEHLRKLLEETNAGQVSGTMSRSGQPPLLFSSCVSMEDQILLSGCECQEHTENDRVCSAIDIHCLRQYQPEKVNRQ